MERRESILIFLSFLAIYLIWGSTYLFVANVVEEIPPFLMAGLRFFLSGCLMFCVLKLFRKGVRVSKKQFFNAAVAGILFLTFGIGGSSWAMQYVDSGFTALLISTQPLLIVLGLWAIDGARPSFKAFFGVFLGMFGMFLLVSQDTLVVEASQKLAVAVILLGMTAWTIGSVFVGRADMPKDQMTNNTIQMFTGCLILFLLSFLMERPAQFEWAEVSTRAWFSIAYLVLFGSVLAFTAFNFLLSRVSAEKVSTATYVNPVVALFLGWYFRDELVSLQSIFAAAVMLSGVYFINSNKPKTIVPNRR